jgi:hypothetical protein
MKINDRAHQNDHFASLCVVLRMVVDEQESVAPRRPSSSKVLVLVKVRKMGKKKSCSILFQLGI